MRGCVNHVGFKFPIITLLLTLAVGIVAAYGSDATATPTTVEVEKIVEVENIVEVTPAQVSLLPQWVPAETLRSL